MPEFYNNHRIFHFSIYFRSNFAWCANPFR